MSKANAKATDKAHEAADTATGSGAAAMVPAVTPAAPPAPAKAPAPDRHTGKGGLYTRVNGVRTLVERTEQPDHEATTTKE